MPGRDSRLVLLRPRVLGPGLYEVLLDLNFRRLGWGVYRPQCDGCVECRQIRLPAERFEPDRGQRRCLKKNADVVVTAGPPDPTGRVGASVPPPRSACQKLVDAPRTGRGRQSVNAHST